MSSPAFDSRDGLEAHQLAALNTVIEEALAENPFYAPRLRAAGITGPVDKLASFTSRAPFTTKAELIADEDAHPPYGSNRSRPLEEYVRLHQTSSTTGRPLRWLDTQESWDWMIEGWTQVLVAAGVTKKDRLFAAFSFGPFMGFWLGYEAAARMGCLVIPGGAMNSVSRLRAILANEVTVLACTPTYALRLGETAREAGVDLSRSKVRALVVGGEPGGSLPATRGRIEAFWPGVTVFDHHGMTESGPATYQCPQRAGLLHLIESHLLCEFVDPETSEPANEPSSETAELVVTTLGRTSSPLLRYRTGDLVRLAPPAPHGVCPCGRIERTIEGGVIGRVDDMVFVRGVNLYPSAVEEVLSSVPGVAEHRVEVREERGMTELRLIIEPEPGVRDDEALRGAVAGAFRTAFNLRTPIDIVEPGALPRFELKSKRWARADDRATV